MRDINGDGWPEIVLIDYSGGAHCCTHLTILSLRAKGPVCILSEELGSASAEFHDLYGNGTLEITTARLAEYALGSFAEGTYAIPVIYSAGSDGVYRVNTRAFPDVLNADLSKELAEFSAQGADTGAEQRDTLRVNLFVLNYLLDRKSEAYQSLSGIVATDELGIPAVFAKVVETLKATAPEVLNETEWTSLSATLAIQTGHSSSGVTTTPETGSTNPTSSTMDPTSRTFTVSDDLVVIRADGQKCALTSGDLIMRLSDTPDGNNMQNARVSSSKKSDCAVGQIVTVKVDDLQAMQNHFREQLSRGLRELANEQAPAKSGEVRVPAVTDPRRAVLEVINTWVKSFKDKDSNAHADCYAPTVETYFKMHNVPNERILQYKRQAFSELLTIRRYELSQMYISAPVGDRSSRPSLKSGIPLRHPMPHTRGRKRKDSHSRTSPELEDC